MAFQFIVEDGSMVPNSNSYLTVDEADTYISANIHAYPMWANLDTLSQQQLLVWASRHLDQRATWNGTLTSLYLADPQLTNLIATWAVPSVPNDVPEQSMRWPRAGVQDLDGSLIMQNVIPRRLKEACAEMARYLIADDRSLERPQDFLTELRAGDLILKFRDSVLALIPSEVAYILRGLGYVSSGRVNFSKIHKV